MKKLAEVDSWNIEPLGSLLQKSKTNLVGGATPKGARYVEKSVPFIRIQNVNPNKLNLSDIKHIIRAFHEKLLKRSQLKTGDVLLTITGSYGISAVVPPELGEANINRHVVKIEINTSRLRPEYLACFLNTELCKQQFNRAVTGGTRPALDYDAIKATMILYPVDLTVQNRIVQRVYVILEKAEEAEKTMVEAKATTSENILLV